MRMSANRGSSATELQTGRETVANAAWERVVLSDCLLHQADHLCHGGVVGGQVSLLLIAEVVVEGAPGDACGRDDVLHRHRRVARQARHVCDRIEDPLALV